MIIIYIPLINCINYCHGVTSFYETVVKQQKNSDNRSLLRYKRVVMMA